MEKFEVLEVASTEDFGVWGDIVSFWTDLGDNLSAFSVLAAAALLGLSFRVALLSALGDTLRFSVLVVVTFKGDPAAVLNPTDSLSGLLGDSLSALGLRGDSFSTQGLPDDILSDFGLAGLHSFSTPKELNSLSLMGEVSSFLEFSGDLLGDEGTSTLDGEVSTCDGEEGKLLTFGFFLGDDGFL